MSDEEYVKQDDDYLENDEFEENMYETIEQYQQQSKPINRPESHHGRPESSKVSGYKSEKGGGYSLPQVVENSPPAEIAFDDQQMNYYQQQDNIDNNYGPAVDKLNKEVQFYKLDLETFWKSNRIFAEPQEFHGFIKAIGLDPTNMDFSSIFDEQGNITINKLCSVIHYWKNNENAMLEFIKERAFSVAKTSKKKVTKQFKIKQTGLRPKSSLSQVGRPISGISHKSFKSKMSEVEQLEQIEQEVYEKKVVNSSSHYLKKHQEKERAKEHHLQLTINKGKSEYEYEMLIKMGQANELSQQLSRNTTYRAYKGAQGNLKVNVWNKDKREQTMTLEEFQREFNAIKKLYNQENNLKIWEVSAQKQQKAPLIPSKEKSEQQEGGMRGTQINKKDRQIELKEVLLETMMLTNILKEQLYVLNKKGINSNYNNQQTGRMSASGNQTTYN